MQEAARKYTIAETLGSFVVNGILNCLPAYLIFRHHPVIAMQGKGGMFQDSIGMTFIVTYLSYLVPVLIGRSRRKAGTLPLAEPREKTAGNVYLRALGVAALFTLVLTTLNFVLLPRIFGDAVTLRTEVLFKTFYGAVFGAIASYLAIQRTLHEAEAPLGKR